MSTLWHYGTQNTHRIIKLFVSGWYWYHFLLKDGLNRKTPRWCGITKVLHIIIRYPQYMAYPQNYMLHYNPELSHLPYLNSRDTNKNAKVNRNMHLRLILCSTLYYIGTVGDYKDETANRVLIQT